MDIEIADILDWEPLTIRFPFPDDSPERDIQAAKTLLENWFESFSERQFDDVNLHYWHVYQHDKVTIAADCEWLSEKGVERLAETMAREFPQILKLVLGQDAHTRVPSEIVWHRLAKPALKSGTEGKSARALLVSVFHISIEQYCKFLESSGYVPSYCRENETDDISIFEHHQIAPAGRGFLQNPVTLIRLSDAEAFCEFMNCRLPTEFELFDFFNSYLANGAEFTCIHENWTSSRVSTAQQIIMTTPRKQSEIQSVEKMTQIRDPDNYELPFPSFRVCKECND